MSDVTPARAIIGELRSILARADRDDTQLKELIESRSSVEARYGKLFSADGIQDLSEHDFRDFLLFKNNLHWHGLHRLSGHVCADMNRLRDALRILLYESRPIADRLNELVPPKGASFVWGLSKAILTPILMIAYPNKCAVWNKVSEGAMQKLRLWPDFDRGEPFGDRYDRINAVQLDVARELGIDTWTLDALWWRVVKPFGSNGKEPDGDEQTDTGIIPERHLRDFLVYNWQQTPLGKEWSIYEYDGNPLEGVEYHCDIGFIDILARHREDPTWLVIELKRGQSSDKTVGQILRYMGWVRKHLAEEDEQVRGLVIAHSGNDALWYALSEAGNIELLLYKVDFHLHPAKPPNDSR